MEYRDYYKILGVPRGATQAEIKKAFRKLARQFHPDVNKSDAAAERRFKEANEANAVLGDPEKRRAYDALGANWSAYQQAGDGAGPFADFMRGAGGAGPGGVRFEFHGNAEDMAGFSDFFRTFFGGAGGGFDGASVRGRPAGTYATQTRSGRRAQAGPGFGDILEELSLDDMAPLDDLPDMGRGRRRGPAGQGGGTPHGRSRDVEGEAEVSLEEVFHGTTRMVQIDRRRLEVKIPPGVADGQRIRLSGTAGDGGTGGDVYLRVRVRPHPDFERNGADLTRDLAVPLRVALLGGEVPLETIAGNRLLLTVPPETQPGRIIRLAGQGLPRFRADGRGNLFVRIRVVLPTGLDQDARELAARFLDAAGQPETDPARTQRSTNRA